MNFSRPSAIEGEVMSLTFNAATARLVREMQASEIAIADALVATTALMHSAALAQREFSAAPPVKTQAALIHLNKTLTGLVDAQVEAKRVHSQLLDIAREMSATESPFCPEASGNLQEQRAA